MDKSTEKIEYDDGGFALIDKIDGENHGWWIVYNGEGSKKWERHYYKGKQNGPDRAWHPNNKLKSECNFKNGELNGLWQTWYLNGQLKNDCYFVNGEQMFYSRWYDINGNLIAECTIDDSDKNGTDVATVVINEDTHETSLAIVTHEFGKFKGYKEIDELEE